MKSARLPVFPFIAALLLLAAGAIPSAHSAGLPKPDAALVRDLISAAKEQVKTFSRPVSIYHWTHRSDVQIPIQGLVQAGDPHFAQYLERRYRSFYKPDPRNGSMLGTGLYGATDPSSTRSYGGRNWVVYQLEFKKGVRFLNVSGTESLSSDLSNRLISFGCQAFSLYSIFANDSVPACQVLRAALADSKELDVQALRYPYSAASIPGCSRDTRHAFLVWGGRDFAATAAFIREFPTPQAKDTLHDQRVLLQQVYMLDPAAQTKARSSGDESPYPEFNRATPRVKAQDWVKSHLMGCSRHSEDR